MMPYSHLARHLEEKLEYEPIEGLADAARRTKGALQPSRVVRVCHFGSADRPAMEVVGRWRGDTMLSFVNDCSWPILLKNSIGRVGCR